jgi:integrase
LHPRSESVFINMDGLPYTKSALFHRLQRWCNKEKIHGMPYSLRHTFGTAQAQCKTNQAVISQVMGHTSLQTTARYINNNTSSHFQAVDDAERQMESVLSTPHGMQNRCKSGRGGKTGEKIRNAFWRRRNRILFEIVLIAALT